MATNLEIREALESDIEEIQKIFAYYVKETTLTFRHKVIPLQAMISTFQDITEKQKLPYLVAVSGSSVIGYTYVSGYRGYMIGYAPTVELSLFCHPDHLGKGTGSQLLDKLLEKLKGRKHVTHEAYYEDEKVEVDIKEVLAVMAIDDGRQGLGLRDWYIKKGFEQVGQLKRVGLKHGKMIDTIYLQRSI